jgi:hypothetical protein
VYNVSLLNVLSKGTKMESGIVWTNQNDSNIVNMPIDEAKKTPKVGNCRRGQM